MGQHVLSFEAGTHIQNALHIVARHFRQTLSVEHEVAAALLPVAEALVVGNGRGVDGVAGLTQLIQGAAFHAVLFFGSVSKISRNGHVFNHLQVYFGHDFSPKPSFSEGRLVTSRRPAARPGPYLKVHQ